MENIIIQLHEVNILSTIVRLTLAIILGGVIGLERGAHNHPAGFRTHILVCVGSCLAMMTNQYIFENISELADPARLGAQVITGIGFLGVGTIIVTGRYKIKGLTTAAGLWASACTGLALGIGFYSGAIIAGILIFATLTLMAKFEYRFFRKARILDLYIELESVQHVKTLLSYIKENDIEILNKTFSQNSPISGDIGLQVTLRLSKEKIKQSKGEYYYEVIELINQYEGVYIVEEI